MLVTPWKQMTARSVVESIAFQVFSHRLTRNTWWHFSFVLYSVMTSPPTKRRKIEKGEDAIECPPNISKPVDVNAVAGDKSGTSEFEIPKLQEIPVASEDISVLVKSDTFSDKTPPKKKIRIEQEGEEGGIKKVLNTTPKQF